MDHKQQEELQKVFHGDITPYAELLSAEHHVSAKHPRMSMHDRAAQFSPFAALTGYSDVVEETAKSQEARELESGNEAFEELP